jgi:hypothetical protein
MPLLNMQRAVKSPADLETDGVRAVHTGTKAHMISELLGFYSDKDAELCFDVYNLGELPGGADAESVREYSAHYLAPALLDRINWEAPIAFSAIIKGVYMSGLPASDAHLNRFGNIVHHISLGFDLAPF